jgi:hypothetical protein
MPTAVIDIQLMLEQVIQSDGVLDGLLSGKKVYAGIAPKNSALPYVMLGQTGETPEGAGYYRQPGHFGTENLHCWARTKDTAQQIFARLYELLGDQRPVLANHRIMRGTLEYVDDGEGPPTPDGKSSNTWQVWARYRVRSLVGA